MKLGRSETMQDTVRNSRHGTKSIIIQSHIFSFFAKQNQYLMFACFENVNIGSRRYNDIWFATDRNMIFFDQIFFAV